MGWDARRFDLRMRWDMMGAQGMGWDARSIFFSRETEGKKWMRSRRRRGETRIRQKKVHWEGLERSRGNGVGLPSLTRDDFPTREWESVSDERARERERGATAGSMTEFLDSGSARTGGGVGEERVSVGVGRGSEEGARLASYLPGRKRVRLLTFQRSYSLSGNELGQEGASAEGMRLERKHWRETEGTRHNCVIAATRVDCALSACACVESVRSNRSMKPR
ncbi:hypothetical protein BJ546DRAFT_525664 [Cryomyces antarcticus]